MPRPKIKELTRRQLGCYRFRHEDKMTLVAIGDELGISEGMVRQHLKIAEKKLDHKALPTAHVARLGERIARNSSTFQDALGDQSTATVLRLMGEKRLEAITMLDKQVLAKETGRGLAQIISILSDKIQLLKGEPTAITKIEDVRKMDEVAVLLLAEVKRRGIVLDGDLDQESLTFPHLI